MADRDITTLLREAYAAFSRGDHEAVLRDMHPEFELQRPERGPHGGMVISGREALLEYFRPEAFDQERETPIDVIENADVALVRSRSFARGAGSGIEIAQDMFHVWRIRDGRPARLEIYLDRDRAYRAAGLQP